MVSNIDPYSPIDFTRALRRKRTSHRGSWASCSKLRFLNERQTRWEIDLEMKRRRKQWYSFDLDKMESLPNAPCCYVLYFDRRLVYVGSTESLSKRIKGHVEYARYSAGYTTAWGYCNSVIVKAKFPNYYGQWLMTEFRLIRRLKPLFNIKGVE